jgi:hypothetical protein
MDHETLKIDKIYPCEKCNQPERSKREDSKPKPLSVPFLPDEVEINEDEGLKVYGKFIRLV